MLREWELLDHLRVKGMFVLPIFSVNDLVITFMLDYHKYLRVASHTHAIIILSQLSGILPWLVIL